MRDKQGDRYVKGPDGSFEAKHSRRTYCNRKLWSQEVNPYIVLAVYDKISSVDDISRYFVTVCEGIIAFNQVYGAQVLGLCAVILFCASDQIKNAIYSLTVTDQVENAVMIVKFIYSCNLMVYAFLVVRPSTKMNYEVEEIVSACHKFVGSIPLGTGLVSQRFLVKKIYFLTAQLRYHAPYFTASDMFEISYGMILRIVAGVISFSVVFVHIGYRKA
nr:unnamed protein product [Callosobruchus chinensis]